MTRAPPNAPELKSVSVGCLFPASDDLERAPVLPHVVQVLTLTWTTTVPAKYDVAATVRANIKNIAQYSSTGSRVSSSYHFRDRSILISKEYRLVETDE